MTMKPGVVALAALLLAGPAIAGEGTAADGIYSAAQAERGAAVYERSCVACHAPDMTGAPGSPPLVGRLFMIVWEGETVGALYDYLKTMMPTGAAGTLTDQQYADVLALLLETNGFPASAEGAELAPDPAALAAIAIGPTPQ